MVNTNYKIFFIFLMVFACFADAKRFQIRSVGSTTVYPFSVKTAEIFARKYKNLEPIITSTGTGQGMAIFCGPNQHPFSPDFTGASRKIKDKEIEMCHKNGVKEILEVPFGYDGIILGIKKGHKLFNIKLEELFLAAAAKVPNKHGKIVKNPYKKWSDINPKLPNEKIQILLPQTKNGTYGSYIELVMDKGCAENDAMKKHIESSGKSYKEICRTYRTDGNHVINATKYDLGDSHDLFVQKVYDNPGMLGVMGYSFIKQFDKKIDAIPVESVPPSLSNIASLEYPLSRPLYIYVRKDRYNQVEGLKDFIEFYRSAEVSGENGILKKLGLVPFDLASRPAISTVH
jgi:phosphate transport system substrate-binding protein